MNAISTLVNIPMCRSIEDIHSASHEDAHLQELEAYIIQGLPHKRDKMDHRMRPYWPIRNGLTMINGIVMKAKRIIVPFQLQEHIL